MIRAQVWELVNKASSEALGRENVLNEDLSNVVDTGEEIFNANAVDNYVRSLVNHIGKTIFVNRPYRGKMLSVMMDGWEYGSALEKVQADMPEAMENETWELQDGASYDPNIFYKPSVSVKFFNKRVTFEIPRSITERQVKESFSSEVQLNGFVSMLYTSVENSMTVKMEQLIRRTVNNMIGETVFSEFPNAVYNNSSGVRAVNLLHLYKEANPDAEDLTAEQAITDPEFVRYASYMLGEYIDRLQVMSTLFNVGGKERFTPSDALHCVMLSRFKNAASVYLQSDTFHDQYTALPNAETVPYWQGSGTDYSFDETSKIDIKTSENHNIELGGILCVMFDRWALGVSNLDRRVTTNYNAKAEFFNNYYKFDAGYFNDLNENFVVFFVA